MLYGNADRRTIGRERKFVSGVNGNSSEFTQHSPPLLRVKEIPCISVVVMELPSLVGWFSIKGSTSVFAPGSLVIPNEVATVTLGLLRGPVWLGSCRASISVATLFIDPWCKLSGGHEQRLADNCLVNYIFYPVAICSSAAGAFGSTYLTRFMPILTDLSAHFSPRFPCHQLCSFKTQSAVHFASL